MSDILIKDLPLPQEGEYDYHLTIRSDGKVEGTQQVGERIHGINTWAIELPPHGRLIDADEELYQLSTSFFPQDMETTKLVARYRKWIKNAPTVLEASDEGNIFINSLTN